MHLCFFWVVQTDTSVPQNLEIRLKTKILSYTQNQVEFIEQSFALFTTMDLCDVINTQNQERKAGN